MSRTHPPTLLLRSTLEASIFSPSTNKLRRAEQLQAGEGVGIPLPLLGPPIDTSAVVGHPLVSFSEDIEDSQLQSQMNF